MMTSIQRVNAFAELRARKRIVADTLRHVLTTTPVEEVATETDMDPQSVVRFATMAQGKIAYFRPIERYLCAHGHLRITEIDR